MPSQIIMGFEPGEQAAGGKWEGKVVDMQTARLVKRQGYGGCMVWAANPSAVQAPRGAKVAPEVAAGLARILEPSWRFGQVPVYTKADPNTGWLPAVRGEAAQHRHKESARSHLPARLPLSRRESGSVAVMQPERLT